MQIVVPMAGEGRRFAEAGYELPKPLIPVAGFPMVVRAVRDLPPAKKTIFVCHPLHVARHAIDNVLAQYVPGCRIVIAPGLTQGQACSVRLAADHLDPKQPVLVAACDNTHLYDRGKFARLAADLMVDVLVWTYRGDPRVLVKPEMYGWVATTNDGVVTEVSVKKPLSSQPINDQVVSGCFWFRTARILLDGIDWLVAADQRVNNEFYLDAVPNVLVPRGYRVMVFETDKYIGWGTPHDLEDYERWQRYFQSQSRAA